MAEKLPKQVFPADISDFWISRGNFRVNIRLEHTKISKLALTYQNKPHLWSNHQVSTQSPHIWPRNYPKTVFCLEMTEFCNFSRYFSRISGPQISQIFKSTFSLTSPSYLWSNHLVSTYYAHKRPSNHRKITKTPIFTSFTGQKCQNADSAIFIWQLRVEGNRDTDLPTRIKSSLEVLTGIQLVWGTRNIPRSQEKPQKSKKNRKSAFPEKNKDKMGMQFHL